MKLRAIEAPIEDATIVDDFKDAPKSIAEIKADKTENAGLWKPRDVLISLLREIDSGETKVDIVFIAIGQYIDEDEMVDTKTGFRTSGKNHYEISGLVHRAVHMMQTAE